jgi:hypothetical protein
LFAVFVPSCSSALVLRPCTLVLAFDRPSLHFPPGVPPTPSCVYTWFTDTDTQSENPSGSFAALTAVYRRPSVSSVSSVPSQANALPERRHRLLLFRPRIHHTHLQDGECTHLSGPYHCHTAVNFLCIFSTLFQVELSSPLLPYTVGPVSSFSTDDLHRYPSFILVYFGILSGYNTYYRSPGPVTEYLDSLKKRHPSSHLGPYHGHLIRNYGVV